MSRLAARAEVIKLSEVLGRDALQLRFLEAVPAADLRDLRAALDESLFRQQLPPLRRAAAILRWLPRRLAAFLVRHVFGARLSARLAAELPARLLVGMTPYLPAAFVAESVHYADPRRLHDAIQMMPLPISRRILQELLAQRDYMSLGRFVEFLPDAKLRAMEPLIADETVLVEIAFYMDSKNRLEHFLRLLPRERVRQALLLLRDPARRALWPKALLLLMHVGPALQSELAERVVAQGEAAMNALVFAVHEEGLFAEMLPVALALSPAAQKAMANLAVLREPGVIDNILRAADEENVWASQLVMLRWMDEERRALVAEVLERMPSETLERVVNAAVQSDIWEPVLDAVARMSLPRRQHFAEVLKKYGDVDPELLRRVARQASLYGLQLEG